MSKKRKRISRRRLAGQRVMAHVPIYHIETGKHKPVTAARRFIAENGLSAPSVFNVRRNEHTSNFFERFMTNEILRNFFKKNLKKGL